MGGRNTIDNFFVRKLECFVSLSHEERAALDAVWARQRQVVGASRDLAREGEPPQAIHLIRSGWACRYKLLEDGRRQILSFVLPGDLCDLNIFILKHMDHSVLALTRVEYVALSQSELDGAVIRHPRVMQALCWEALVNSAIQREWTVNLGQRSALERLAHLLCELFSRLEMVGMTTGSSCELPLTQIDLADTLGLTSVHVSRTVKELRERGLIRLHDRRLEIVDFEALCAIALFDAKYLHLAR